MKILIILAIFTQSATSRMTLREKQFNKLQCDKLKQSMESKMDAPIHQWREQFKTMCGQFYPKPVGVLDPRPVISFESFVRWMKTRYETNSAIKQRTINELN